MGSFLPSLSVMLPLPNQEPVSALNGPDCACDCVLNNRPPNNVATVQARTCGDNRIRARTDDARLDCIRKLIKNGGGQFQLTNRDGPSKFLQTRVETRLRTSSCAGDWIDPDDHGLPRPPNMPSFVKIGRLLRVASDTRSGDAEPPKMLRNADFRTRSIPGPYELALALK
jgi:hypothetical protein